MGKVWKRHQQRLRKAATVPPQPVKKEAASTSAVPPRPAKKEAVAPSVVPAKKVSTPSVPKASVKIASKTKKAKTASKK